MQNRSSGYNVGVPIPLSWFITYNLNNYGTTHQTASYQYVVFSQQKSPSISGNYYNSLTWIVGPLKGMISLTFTIIYGFRSRREVVILFTQQYVKAPQAAVLHVLTRAGWKSSNGIKVWILGHQIKTRGEYITKEPFRMWGPLKR